MLHQQVESENIRLKQVWDEELARLKKQLAETDNSLQSVERCRQELEKTQETNRLQSETQQTQI